MRRKTILLSISLSVLIAGACLVYKFNQSVTGSKEADRFLSFPVGKEMNIDLNFAASFDDEYTEREKKDQAKDWLLYTALSDANLSSEALNQVTYDLPITRHGYNRNVFNLDYGDTRSRYVGNGVVAAVIPTCAGDQELDYLFHIVDEQRKNLGKLPEKLQLFEYKIDLANDHASLTHVAAPEVKDLFTKESGYVEQHIMNLDDLKAFLEQTQDITYASNKDGRLVLGGRKFKANTYKSIQLGDIAAIWQSEQEIQRKNDDFEQKWKYKTYTTEEEKIALEEQRSKEIEDLKIVRGSGFSLDPVYDYDLLSSFFNKIRYKLLKYVEFGKISKVQNALEKKDEKPLLEIISQLQQDKDVDTYYFGKDLEAYVFSTRIQKARYDGELKGTEVGMHLFYTDLLAKLWTINYLNSSPNKIIIDFINDQESATNLPKIFTKEAKRFSSARLWFGPNPLGYQVATENEQMFFARNATKIYSASSNPLTPGKEVKTAALFDASIDWWNNHYEEVAKFEQEYNVLNEIMKWSAVIGWLNANNAQNTLNFLADIDVNHENSFPDWAERHKELKFNQWAQIHFFKKGYKGFQTETMPILNSGLFYAKSGLGFGSIEGGVSLAEKSAFKEVTALPKSTNELIRRSNLDYSLIGDELKTVKGNIFKLTNEKGVFKVVSKAEDEAILRSKFEEVSNNSFEKDLFKSPEELSLKVNFNGSSLGDLNIVKTRNGFSVGFQGRDIDMGQSLARKISDSPDPLNFLKGSDDVEAYIKIPGSEEFLIKQKQSSKWMHLKIEDEPEVSLSNQWDSRVSGNSEKSTVCNLKWIDQKDVLSIKGESRLALGSDGKLKFQPVNRADGNSLVPFNLKGEKTDIKAYFNSRTSEVYFDESIVANHNVEITSLERMLRSEDLVKIKQVAASGKEFNYTIDKVYGLKNDLLHSYSDNNYKEFLNHLDNTDDIGYIKKVLKDEKIRDFKQLDAELDPLRRESLLRELNNKYSGIPELKFREGLAKLEFGNYKAGEKMINETLSGIRNNGQFYDEINNLIHNSNLSSEGKQVLGNVADFNAGKAKFVQATFEQVPKGTEVSIDLAAEEIKRGNGFAFIQNNPSLNNIDWNVAIDPAHLASMHNPVCIRLNPQPLSSYDMRVVVQPAVTAEGKLSYNINAIARIPRIAGRSNGDDDDDEKKKKKNKEKAQFYIYFPQQEKRYNRV